MAPTTAQPAFTLRPIEDKRSNWGRKSHSLTKLCCRPLLNIDNKTQKWTTVMQIVDKTKELKSYKSVNQPKYQRLILSDAEEKPMILNLWNELEDTEGVQLLNNMATGPVVMGLRVKVSTFNGLSLSTWFSSTISINAPIQQLMDIKHWYSNKKEPLIEMVSKECYKNTEMLLPPPKEHDISAIGEGIHLEKKYARAIWVKVTTTALPGQTKYWYTACVTCQKAQSTELHWNFKCTMCNTKTKVENRSRVGLLLNDNTGTMVAYAFGKEAEKLMSLTVAKLKKAAEQGIPIHDKVAEYISTHKLICFVRHYDYTYQAIHERRHAITAIYTEDELLAMQGQVASNTIEDVPESDEKNTLVGTKTLLDDTSP